MQFCYLCFCVIGFILLINCIPILTGGIDKNANSTIKSEEVDAKVEVIVLVEKICNLFWCGHSIDEVITILDDHKEYSHEIKKLVPCIYEMLHTQDRKSPILNDIFSYHVVNNKDSGAFYVHKNFYIKAQRVAIILALVVLGYLLFTYRAEFSGLFKSSGGSLNEHCIKKSPVENTRTHEQEDLRRFKDQTDSHEQKATPEKLPQPSGKATVYQHVTSYPCASQTCETFNYKAMINQSTKRRLEETLKRLNPVV